MKKLIFMAALVLLACVVKAQEFRPFNDVDDSDRALKVGVVANISKFNSYGLQVGYKINPFTAYIEGTLSSYTINGQKYNSPSAKVGMDYGFYEYGDLTVFCGAYVAITMYKATFTQNTSNKYVKSYRTRRVKKDGFIAGLRFGAEYEIAERFFVAATAFANTTNWNRSIGKYVGRDARGAVEVGVSVTVGVRF